MKILKKILLLLIFIIPIVASGYEQFYKQYESYPVVKFNPDITNADVEKGKSISNSPDLESNSIQGKSTIIRKFKALLKNEIDRFGCKFVHEKYIIKKTVPTFYNPQHNWNKPSKFNIKDFESTILNCI